MMAGGVSLVDFIRNISTNKQTNKQTTQKTKKQKNTSTKHISKKQWVDNKK